MAIGVVGGLLVFVLTTVRRPPPPMSADDFEAALARWQANRPADYEMQIELFGRQSGTMHVRVTDHAPKLVERNGVAAAEHTWRHWTVDGLLGIIRSDLEGLDQPERAFGATDTSQLVQQAEFDAGLGYPRRYRRAVMSIGEAIEWEITEFVTGPE